MSSYGVSLSLCGADPDATRFPTRDTPLGAAIRGKHDRLAAMLLRAGADPELILPEGQAAFHLAVATGCHQALGYLLDAGMDPDAPFLLPVSPEFLQRVRPGVARWALKKDSGVTPLMVASDSGVIASACLVDETVRRLIELEEYPPG